MRKPYPTDLSDAEWFCIEPYLPTPKAPNGPGCTPCARSLMLSTTSSEVVVLGACCRMSFHLGRPFTTTSELGASMVPGRGCTLPCAIVCEYASREIRNLVRELWIASR